MKAILFDKQGAIENLYETDLSKPEIAPHECLVKTHAVSLNGFDPMIALGTTKLKTPLPMIPCGDAAGEVVAVGSAVAPNTVKIGDRVSLYPYISGIGMMGETAPGVCREYFNAPAQNLIKIPDGVSFIDAAALPIAYGTAYRLIVSRAHIQPGDTVLIIGATGGVGTCCIQLAKNIGATVIATGSAPWKLEQLKEIGADYVIDTSTSDLVTEVHRIAGKPHFTRGGGVDVVVNYVGGDTWSAGFRTVRPRGRIVTCGASAGYSPPTDIRYIWTYELQILGSNGWAPAEQTEVLELVRNGQLKPVIHKVRPMADAVEAIRELHERKVVGKSILTTQ